MTTGCVGRRAVGFASACLVLSTLLASAPAAAGTAYRAVVVGVNDYACNDGGNEDWLLDLTYCVNDANAMSVALQADVRWQGNVTVLTEAAATKAGIEAAIDTMAGDSAAGDVCLFYFSGHGGAATDLSPTPEPDGLDEYIIPQDVDNFDFTSAISDDELSGEVSGHPWLKAITDKGATLIVIFDSCNSGGGFKSPVTRAVKGCGPPRSPDKIYDGIIDDLVKRKPFTKDLDSLPSVVALTACDDWETSCECPDYGNGLFTHHLIEGMTSGLTDTDADGQISVEELHVYVRSRVGSYYFFFEEHWRQHPQMYDGLTGEAEILVAPPASTHVIASVDMSTDPGWACEGEWEWGVPSGMLTYDLLPGPTSGHTGASVYGYNLTWDYPDDLPARYLTSAVFDCSDRRDVKLRFWRWLGVEDRNSDVPAEQWDCAGIEVFDGSSWTPLWSNTIGFDVSDTEWVPVEYDISSLADENSTVQVRWSMGPTDIDYTHMGWNIDDVEIVGRLLVEIAASPTSFSRECVPGFDPSPATDTFEVWNIEAGTLDYQITDDADAGGVDWISCSPASGVSTGEHDTITITYSTATIAAEGVYNATITISDGVSDPFHIPVTMVVARPTIAVGPASLDVVCRYGEDAGDEVFDVWNSGAGTLSYAVTDDANAGGVDWISCAPASGASDGEQDTVTVSFNTSAITTAGPHSATITVADDGTPAPAPDPTFQAVSVSLTVTRPTVATDLGSPTITQYAVEGTDGEPQTFDIWNSGTGVMQFTISDDVSGPPDWISVSPPSGETLVPDEHVAVTVTYDSDTLAVNASPGYEATITISDPAADNDPLLVDVVLVVDVDTDGDGLCDLAEVNVYLTDPTEPDSDGDGFSDGAEVAAGTDPNLPGDHPFVPPPPGGGGCAGGGGASPASATVLAVLFGLVLALRARARLAVAPAAPAARPDRS